MSIHSSLAQSSKGRKHRNVLTREERIAKLVDENRWDESKSVFALPKVRSIKPLTAKKKAPKKEAAATAEGEAAPAAAAAPAEAAKTGKAGKAAK
jgi:small basic protein (TIGR04137 family)